MACIPLTNLPIRTSLCDDEEKQSFNSVIRQLVFVDPNNKNDLLIWNIDNGTLVKTVDRLLMTLSILHEGEYTNSNKGPQFSSLKSYLINEYSSVFAYFVGNKINTKISDNFESSWTRSQSGHWSFIVR